MMFWHTRRVWVVVFFLMQDLIFLLFHTQFVNPGQAAPHEVDWRGKGVLTSVKDQGQCGSCWSFASSEAIESAWAITTGELSVLSEQVS